jgi:hypothetical protein
MAALTLTTPVRAGVATPGAAVAASDTIAASLLGSRGAILEILNGNASPDTVVISDASITTSGAAAAPNSVSVTNATNRAFKITPDMADPVTQLVTVTHTVTATVTYKLYPRD